MMPHNMHFSSWLCMKIMFQVGLHAGRRAGPGGRLGCLMTPHLKSRRKGLAVSAAPVQSAGILVMLMMLGQAALRFQNLQQSGQSAVGGLELPRLSSGLQDEVQYHHSVICSLARSLTRSLTHRLTHPLTHPLTHSPKHSPIHSVTHSLTHSPTHPCTHPPVRSFVQLCVHSCFRSFVCLYVLGPTMTNHGFWQTVSYKLMILCRDIYALLHVISLVDWPKHVFFFFFDHLTDSLG